MSNTLPKSLIDTVNNPTTSEGQRHAEMIRVILQLVGNRVPDGEIFARMKQNYPHKVDKDILNAIAGAHGRNPSPTVGASQRDARALNYVQPDKIAHRRRFKLAADKVAAPEEKECSIIGFLESMFRPEETICITPDADLGEDGKYHIKSVGTFLTLEEWREKLPEWEKSGRFRRDWGAWIRVNPMTGGKENPRGDDSEVSDYRYCMVEFDDGKTTDEQWSIFQQSGLPIAACISSGGKSVHAWVKVDAKNLEEFKARRDTIYDFFADYNPDPSNKNPSRWSRLAGAYRGENQQPQKLLALNIGAASWEEWESEIQEHEMPGEVTLDEMWEFDPENDPDSMIGKRWLCRGGSLIIQGQSGIGKSSFLMQAGMTWALGRDLFGITPRHALKSIVLQAENDKGDMAEMFQGVASSMSLTGDDKHLLRSNLKFYREHTRTGLEFIRVAEKLIRRNKADIIFADPLLAFVGEDISKQEVLSRFLRNWLNPVIVDTGVIWVWLHHVGKPKGSDATKGQTDKDKSYAGLGSSELVNWAREMATLESAGQDGNVFELSLTKRGKRSGMTDRKDNFCTRVRLQHAKGKILWEYCPQDTKFNVVHGKSRPSPIDDEVDAPF